MGLAGKILELLFGTAKNPVVEIAEVFRENQEAAAQRHAHARSAALEQFAQEFSNERKGMFDRFVDSLNRLPRPMMALGTIALFVVAMFDPQWFAGRMAGLTAVPEPMWWLLGAIVSFYFGARYQIKGQEFQKSLATSLARAEKVVTELKTPTAALPKSDNAAVDDWHRWKGNRAF